MSTVKLFIKYLLIFSLTSVFLLSFAVAWESFSFAWELSDATESSVWILERILNIWYIVIWPMLVVAGSTMDNSFVYWSIINFDQYLWYFWNMTKNFANFALWFVFLLAIIFYFFWYKQEKFWPKRFFPRMLLAWVTIQASWFIVAVIIDISTILTYSVWSMPLNVVRWSEVFDRNVLVQNSVSDIEGIWNTFNSTWSNLVWFKDWESSYLPCGFERREWDYYFSWDLFDQIQSSASEISDSSGNIELDVDWWSCVVQLLWNRLIEAPDDSLSITQIKEEIEEDWSEWTDVWIPISELMSVWEWLTWVFYTLFWSFLWSSTMATSTYWLSSDTPSWPMLAVLLMKIFIWLALLVPLFALVIILIVRVFLLWFLIAFSPLFALVYSMDLWLSEKMWKFSLSWFFWLILLPVFVVFALSIWLILMTILSESIWNTHETNPIWIAMAQREDTSNSCWEIWDEFPDVCFGEPESNAIWFSIFLDYFSWIVINIFWIAVMWILVFAAIRSAKITSWIADYIDTHARGLLKTAPVVPSHTWVHSIWELKKAKQRLNEVPGNAYERQYREWAGQHVNEFQQRLSWNNRWRDSSDDQDQWASWDGGDGNQNR